MIKKAIYSLLPPGKWTGSQSFSDALNELENTSNEVIKKINVETAIDFCLPNKQNSKWAKILNVDPTEISQKLSLDKGASLFYLSKLLTDDIKIEEIDLYKVKVKNIPSDGFKAGDGAGDSQPNPIIELLEALKPAYVSFEYYNEDNGRIA